MSGSNTPAEASPIGARPLLRATDREALNEGLWANYRAELRLAIPGDRPFFALANRVEIGGVTLHYCRYDSPVEIQFSNMVGVRQIHCLSGHGQVTSRGRQVAIGGESTMIIPPDSSFTAAYDEGYQHIVSQFDEGALKQKAEALLGAPLRSSLELPLLESLPVGPRLRSQEIVYSLGRMLSLGEGIIDPPVQEMGQALSSAFLIENLAGFAESMAHEPKAAGGASVRLLEDYIQQNWNRPLSVEEIAAACGVSVRSVFARFKQQRGVAPLTYVRDLRLDHAQRMLLANNHDLSVISIAMACGFASFGHFARRYRERFGELPSTTRARSRG